jgi:predicted nucleic acid-binding Zn ribbon protein
MFFRKPRLTTCGVCAKPIEPKERRFVDKNRITKVERHVHVACHTAEPSTRQPR